MITVVIFLTIGILLVLFPRVAKEYNESVYKGHPLSAFVGGYRGEYHVATFRVMGVIFVAVSGVVCYLQYW